MSLKKFTETRQEFIKNHKKAFIFLTVGVTLDALTTLIFMREFGVEGKLYKPLRVVAELFGPELGVTGSHLAYIYAVSSLAGNLERFWPKLSGEFYMVGLSVNKYLAGFINLAYLIDRSGLLY